jgi:hypothetical protein
VTEAVSETAVIGLVIGNVMWPSILGALFLSRIWKVSTAARPKQAQQEKAEPVTSEMPAIFTDRKAS